MSTTASGGLWLHMQCFDFWLLQSSVENTGHFILVPKG
jgi:hypothetical protein